VARADAAESLRVLEALVAKDATNAEWQQQLARSRVESGRLALARNDPDAADKMLRLAREAIEQLRAKSPDDRNLILSAAQADIVTGELAARRKDVKASAESWARARDSIAAAAQSGSDVNFLATWATSLLLLDDIEQARPIVSKLAAIGYRTPDFLALTAAKQLAYPENAERSQRIADILKPGSESGSASR
jgi:hypothetical protein